MIKLTRLGGEEFVLNADLIRYVEARPTRSSRSPSAIAWSSKSRWTKCSGGPSTISGPSTRFPRSEPNAAAAEIPEVGPPRRPIEPASID